MSCFIRNHPANPHPRRKKDPVIGISAAIYLPAWVTQEDLHIPAGTALRGIPWHRFHGYPEKPATHFRFF